MSDNTPENKVSSDSEKPELSIKVNRIMSDVVKIIKEVFLESFNKFRITAEDFRHVSVTNVIYDESVHTIDFTGISKLIISNEDSICYIIQRKRSEDEAIFCIMWTAYSANRMYGYDQFPMIKITKDTAAYRDETFVRPALKWQDIALSKIKAMFESENECTKDTTENETPDEEFKNRISYIMDHVLNLLIDETKKEFNKDNVIIDCYESFGRPPIRQFLDFKAVDISSFVKFVSGCGFWNIRKSLALSNDYRVTYCIEWPDTGVTPKIIITRNGCRFHSGNMTGNDLMDSALPKIEELCKSFNDDTPENKNDDKLVLNEGEEEKSEDEMLNETRLDITRTFLRNNLIKDILVRIAIAVNGTTNTRNNITFQKDKNDIKTAKSFCDIDVYSYDTFVIGDKDKDKFIVVKRNYSDNSTVLYISNTAKNGTAMITITDKSANFVKGSLLFSSNEYEKAAAVEIHRLCEEYSESFRGVPETFVPSTSQKENDVSHVPPIDDKPVILDKDSIKTISFTQDHDVSNMIYDAFKFVVDKYTKHSKCPISRIPRSIFDKPINPTFFGYSINIPIDHNGHVRQEIILRCDKIKPIQSRYEVSYFIGCGDTCSHSPLMINVYRDGYCRINRVRGDVSTNLFVDKVITILEELIKHHNDSLAEKRLNQLKTTHKEENNMNNKKNEEYMIQGIIPEYEFGKYYKKDGDKFVVVEDDKKWGTYTVYTNEGSVLEPEYKKVEFSTAIATTIKDVIFDDPATTVLWTDGTKTTVKRMTTKYQPVITKDGGKEVPVERVPFDPEAALAAAIMNKLFGTHSRYSKFVKGYVAVAEEKAKKKAKLKAKKEAAKSEKAKKKTTTKRSTIKKTK